MTTKNEKTKRPAVVHLAGARELPYVFTKDQLKWLMEFLGVTEDDTLRITITRASRNATTKFFDDWLRVAREQETRP